MRRRRAWRSRPRSGTGSMFGRLPDHLRRGQRPAAGQRRSAAVRPGATRAVISVLEGVDPPGELADVGQQLRGQPADQRVPGRCARSQVGQPVLMHGSRSRPRAGTSSSGSSSCRCQRSRFCILVRSASRSSRWSTSSFSSRERGVVLGHAADRARAARPGRSPVRRSGRTCPACGRCCGSRPSASAAPAPPSLRRPAGPAPAGSTRAGSPRPPTPRSLGELAARPPQQLPVPGIGGAAPSRCRRCAADLVDRHRACGCPCGRRLPTRPPWRRSPPSAQRGDGRVGRRTHLSGGAATLLSSHAGRP